MRATPLISHISSRIRFHFHPVSTGSAVWIALDYFNPAKEAWTKDNADISAAGSCRSIADLSEIENVTGTAFADYLRGDAENNLLGSGDREDTFAFRTGWGTDTIVDFANDGFEKIDLTGVAGATSLAALTVSNVTGGTEVAFNGDTILLLGLSATDLDSTDFSFALA